MIKFAVIGVGTFGIKRATAIKNSNKAKLVAICDLNKDNVLKAQKILKVPFKSFDEILKDNEIEVVCISTPNKFHMTMIIDCLKIK